MFVNVSYTHPVILVTYLALTIWALVSIWRHGRADTGQKVIWTIVVVAAPYIGALVWAVLLAVGSRRRSTSGA
ncbi:hypothetical protein Cfla_0305 [Cellulomonas flavigena DSM 20109]|uniref:Cardiolipin synthase N-terminal domain-containing protein n=1 Tax=Cellulomonas flavigena (strain ATCC 482 / DSM 20109 / BCRC 11376 / JCM 18109 / NBRC 3775 / NCIMB 8073 / NRS 134) TaxID=446466 RepID=D5UH21_CELFN|nr:PLDc N-terminal domain-containing protein [Cellulomonas flavigena]ADG73224.1 hypothetical protein Cfla_0305 [Cellulomonas flavigena DSM 20109]